MVNEVDPINDSWYQHLDKGQRFRVVEVDEGTMLVEIQYFDGNLEEIDLSDWRQMDIELIAEPENWAGALDIAEPDDFGTSITDTSPTDWTEPLREVRDETAGSLSANAESGDGEVMDDWGEGPPLEEPWEEES